MTSELALPAQALPGGTVPPLPHCPSGHRSDFRGWHEAIWPLGRGGAGGTDRSVPPVTMHGVSGRWGVRGAIYSSGTHR